MATPPQGSAVEAANEALADLRLSMDSPAPVERVTSLNGDIGRRGSQSNGTMHHADGQTHNALTLLREELKRTRGEKEALSTQYNNLVAKLTAMRTSLGNKLKQDAEELDRREQLVQTLTAQNSDLGSTVETLKTELISSNSEAERVSRELEIMRSRAFEETVHETLLREREMRELTAELEKCRTERDEWERSAMDERVEVEESRASLSALRRELEMERAEREREAYELDREKEKSTNLQSVLEDFQSVKEHELRQSLADYESQIKRAAKFLEEYKNRAVKAESELASSTTNSQRLHDLEKEVKEKNLLIGKLRHEAVIINEHLTEALRQLRKSSTDNNVDRRLVTNVLLSFLTTPRADAKRFEMLSLLASVLGWSDAEREKAGLQKAGLGVGGRSLLGGGSPSRKSSELGKIDETESFSRMWVEFLLKEAAQGASAPPPQTPTSPTLPISPSLASPTKRAVSFGGSSALGLSASSSLQGTRDSKTPEP